MTGCYPSDHIDKNCTHGVPINIDCSWCMYEIDSSPMVRQIHLLSDMVYRLEKRIVDIEYRLENIVKFPTEVDIRLEEVERIIEKNMYDIRKKPSKLVTWIDKLESRIACIEEFHNHSIIRKRD